MRYFNIRQISLLIIIFCISFTSFSIENSKSNVSSSNWIDLGNLSSMRFTLNDKGHTLIEFKIDNGNVKFNEDDLVIVQNDKNSISQFRVISFDNTDTGTIFLCEGNSNFFLNNIVSLISVNSTSGKLSFPISKKCSSQITKSFQEWDMGKVNVSNENGKNVLKSKYTIQFFKRKRTSNNWDIIKTETKSYSKEELEKVVSDWTSKTNSTYIYQCEVNKK